MRSEQQNTRFDKQSIQNRWKRKTFLKYIKFRVNYSKNHINFCATKTILINSNYNSCFIWKKISCCCFVAVKWMQVNKIQCGFFIQWVKKPVKYSKSHFEDENHRSTTLNSQQQTKNRINYLIQRKINYEIILKKKKLKSSERWDIFTSRFMHLNFNKNNISHIIYHKHTYKTSWPHFARDNHHHSEIVAKKVCEKKQNYNLFCISKEKFYF